VHRQSFTRETVASQTGPSALLSMAIPRAKTRDGCFVDRHVELLKGVRFFTLVLIETKYRWKPRQCSLKSREGGHGAFVMQRPLVLRAARWQRVNQVDMAGSMVELADCGVAAAATKLARGRWN
jgi:hypothetical protein